MLRRLWILLFVVEHSSTFTENQLIGTPQIQCAEDSIIFTIKTSKAFRGNIYVKGRYNVPQCKQEFFNNDYEGATLTIKLGECGMSRVRQLNPQGMNYVVVFVANFHSTFITKLDRAFNVRCFYAQSENLVSNELEIENLDPEIIEESTLYMPNCEYTLRQETLDGPVPKNAKIGDKIVHRWDCDKSNFGMLVKSCNVTNGGSLSYEVIDSRGCPLLPSLFQEKIKYNSELNLAFVTVSAYAFPDTSTLFFKCQIQVCNKRENECVGMTPPNCPSITQSEFMSASLLNNEALPTQVISTYRESNKLFNSLSADVQKAGDFEKNSLPENKIRTERIEAIQNQNHNYAYFRKKDSPIEMKIEHDAVQQFDNMNRKTHLKTSRQFKGKILTPVRLSNKKYDKFRIRKRRNEEQIMDVVSSPLHIFGEPETVNPFTPPYNKSKNNISRNITQNFCTQNHETMKFIIILAVFLILLIFTYVLMLIIFPRIRRNLLFKQCHTIS